MAEVKGAPFTLTLTRDWDDNPLTKPRTQSFSTGEAMYQWMIENKGKPKRKKRRKSKEEKPK